MKSWLRVLGTALFMCCGVRSSAALPPDWLSKLPPAASRPVNFKEDIKPILELSCAKCHGRGKSKGGFKIDTREDFLRPADSGPAVVIGKSAESHLVELISGLNPEAVMPEKGTKLTPTQVGLMRAWIDQGLKWDSDVSFGKLAPMNLTPVRPELPKAPSGVTHPLDRWLHEYQRTKGMSAGRVIEDKVYVRRVFLDVIGLLPSTAEVEAFVKDSRADKRLRLVNRLLADNQGYAQHWLTFWNDALRNDYAGTGYIDGGRKQISGWLYSALARNVPYNQFVTELVRPNRDSEGFSKGILWRGAVNASQIPPIQAAQNISQVFLGANLKCASCHDSFINDWTLADAYGLANIYSDEPLEMFQCDAPTGKKAPTRFIFPELGAIEGSLSRADRMARLAEIICKPENGRLSRTLVNRLWSRLLGRGLVEPVDEMDQAAWYPPMLDWLAEDFVAHKWDVKHTLRLILTSKAYQLEAVSGGEMAEKEFVFRGPLVRRMSSEQFRDALGTIARVWHEKADGEFDFLAGTSAAKKPMLSPKHTPHWIWISTNAVANAPTGTLYFRKTFRLPVRPSEAQVLCAADNRFTLFVNGNKVGDGSDWERPRQFDLKPYLLEGENVIAAEVVNTGEKPSAAGWVLYGRIRHKPDLSKQTEKIMDLVTDGSWFCTTNKMEGWERPVVNEKGWVNAVEVRWGDYDIPLGRPVEARFARIFSSPLIRSKARASLVRADPLAVALGRPNREQVITTRSSVATTLQGLELTNGATLHNLLKEGATNLIKEFGNSPEPLIQAVYQRALNRRPTDFERETARSMMGQTVQSSGVEDLIWVVTMLPEFQLIN